MRFVPATVWAVAADGDVFLESPPGLLTAHPNGRCAEGQGVTVLLRPTALALSGKPGANQVPVTVRSTSFLGGVRRHHVEVGELRLVVDQPLGTGEEPRSQMWLVVDPAGLHLLPVGVS